MNSYLNFIMGVKTSTLSIIYEDIPMKKSGDIIIFQLSIENISHKPIKHILVKCELPKHIKFHRMASLGLGDSFYSKISHSMVWNLPLLKYKAFKTIDFAVRVMPGLTSGDRIDVKSRILEYQVEDDIIYEFDDSLMKNITLYKV